MNRNLIALIALGPIAVIEARAEIYMTPEKGAASLFPGETLVKKSLRLDPQDISVIEDKSGETVRSPEIVVFSCGKGKVFIDQVIGKHEMITYAVGIASDGKVQGIQVLEYRESYGSQVREDVFKKQFVGKTISSPLKLNDDIKKVSGATLSSAHITGGVRRLLNTYDRVNKKIDQLSPSSGLSS